MQKVIVLTGPTGVGKTDLSLEIAKFLNTDIINGDAFQIYQDIEIATASPTIKEKEQVNHELFNFLDLKESFSICDYQKLVRNKIDEKIKNNKIPFIVGGSGLYINSVVYDYQFSDNKREDSFSETYKDLSNIELHEKLKDLDLKAYNSIHPNNRKRVERAIELALNKDQNINTENEKEKYYDSLIIFLNMDRDKLYDRINKRVDKMVNEGLIEEFENVYPDKLGFQSSKAIGISELITWKEGLISKDEAIELIKQHSRNYAKRQITWFKHKSDAVVVDKENTNFQDLKKIITDFLNK